MKKLFLIGALVLALAALPALAACGHSTSKSNVNFPPKPGGPVSATATPASEIGRPPGTAAAVSSPSVKIAATPGSPQAAATHKLGEAINAGSITLTVHSSFNPPLVNVTAPPAGSTYVGVDVTIQNDGSQPLTMNTLPPMSLIDSSGKTYKVDAVATSAALAATPQATPVGGQTIAPGTSVRTDFGFTVPTSASGLTFVFDASQFGDGQVKVPLS